MRVLSLGAGVQSTTLLLLSCLGELPKLDAAIFADTGWEPQSVYRHLEWLEAAALRYGLPVYRVTAGSLRAAALNRAAFPSGSQSTRIPAYTRDQAGKIGMLPRQCTRDYKIRPIRRKIRELLGRAPTKGCVEQWIGISREEIWRMKESGVAWQVNRYPLIFDRPMRRENCLAWLKQHGFPEPPKSACIGCPYRSDREWRAIRDVPADWEDAVEVDERLREAQGLRGAVYLHRSGVPLPMVDLESAEEKGQLSLWNQECEGYCGV